MRVYVTSINLMVLIKISDRDFFAFSRFFNGFQDYLFAFFARTGFSIVCCMIDFSK